ncbi:hypothetical protein S2M10_09700 [Sphingomonas sp. S2M10]|nr:hypothetical protein [Sphingomonas sp. S2M10]
MDKFSPVKITENDAIVKLTQIYNKEGHSNLTGSINSIDIDGQTASEILKKLRNSGNLIVHNSTQSQREIFYSGGAFPEVLETNFSLDDRRKINEAQTRFQNTVKRAAKQHKEELDKLLGRLNEKLQVELSSIGDGPSSKFPLEVKLTDKRVDVSLKSWGAGTQNRTRILISVLEAIRMRSAVSAEHRTTPVFIVEEPESFLHPSAQAEFGQILNDIAKELDLQIIATTHSPYMLNQNDPSANYLLERKQFRGSPKETTIVPTGGSDWMLPFAENLGIVPKEFASWSKLFGTHAGRVVLVEGEIDKEYFDHIAKKYPGIYSIPSDVEIVPYGGKDSLKNTSILQFMINKFIRVFITFDLDAANEVTRALERIGLSSESDFCGVGVQTPGSDCIEGLVPSSIKKKVFSDHYETVALLGSQDANIRRSAKSKIKSEFLTEFKRGSFDIKELAGFKALMNKIGRAFT